MSFEWLPLTVDKIIKIQEEMTSVFHPVIGTNDPGDIVKWRKENLFTTRDDTVVVVEEPQHLPQFGNLKDDEDCLFRCISWWLYCGDQRHHWLLRSKMVDFMHKYQSKFEGIVKPGGFVDNQGIMADEGEQRGTIVEIKALATMLGCLIFIFCRGRWGVVEPVFTFRKFGDFKFMNGDDEKLNLKEELEDYGGIYLVMDSMDSYDVVTGPWGQPFPPIPRIRKRPHETTDETSSSPPPKRATDTFPAPYSPPRPQFSPELLEMLRTLPPARPPTPSSAPTAPTPPQP